MDVDKLTPPQRALLNLIAAEMATVGKDGKTYIQMPNGDLYVLSDEAVAFIDECRAEGLVDKIAIN